MKSKSEIGEKIRKIRKSCGLSQMELAERVGVSFQQIQKYEKGKDRISVDRLQQIAEALGVSPILFLQTEDNKVEEERAMYQVNFLSKEEKKLLRMFRTIKNKKIKSGLLQQLKGICDLEKEINKNC